VSVVLSVVVRPGLLDGLALLWDWWRHPKDEPR
jgi:hypothetical protein